MNKSEGQILKTGHVTPREEWAEKLGIPPDDVNFEFHLKDKIANLSKDEAEAVLREVGLVEPETKHIPFTGDFIPDWQNRKDIG